MTPFGSRDATPAGSVESGGGGGIGETAVQTIAGARALGGRKTLVTPMDIERAAVSLR